MTHPSSESILQATGKEQRASIDDRDIYNIAELKQKEDSIIDK